MPRPLTIYEINTITWLNDLSNKLQRKITLASVPEEEWQRLSSLNCNAVWLMGVWQRSPAAIEINRADSNFAPAMQEVLPDFDFDHDVAGSAYSISDYTVNEELGGEEALTVARKELNKRGLKLILDYVPNHVAVDHPWATAHPEYFVQGSEADLENEPTPYIKVGDYVLARGRDPQFEAWSDVLQLNVFSPDLRRQVCELLQDLAGKCDGVRCDMAMLLLNDIFSQTWTSHVEVPPEKEFWSELIGYTKQQRPDFLFIAEAYWDTQPRLIELGFDYCYDKTFYDYLIDDHPVGLKRHIEQWSDVQYNLLRFLENHDEPRAAASFDWQQHQAAAVLLNCLPGAVLYYEGQFRGYTVHTPVQLNRDPHQDTNAQVQKFYTEILRLPAVIREDMSKWQVLPAKAYGLNKKPHHSVIAFSWQSKSRYFVSLINWSNKEARLLLNVQSTGKTLAKLFETGKHESYISLEPDRLNCQLGAWQAVIVELIA